MPSLTNRKLRFKPADSYQDLANQAKPTVIRHAKK
jgi:hypothetical protein